MQRRRGVGRRGRGRGEPIRTGPIVSQARVGRPEVAKNQTTWCHFHRLSTQNLPRPEIIAAEGLVSISFGDTRGRP